MIKPIFIVLLILTSCNKNNVQSLPGYYIIHKPGFMERLFTSKKAYQYRIIGSELWLAEDSSFVYTTCGNINKGKWELQGDSLMLHVSFNRFRIDSLNHVRKAEIPNVPLIFKVEKDKIYRYFISEGRSKTIEILVKKR